MRLLLLALCTCAVALSTSTARAESDDEWVMQDLENERPGETTACGDGLVASEATQGHCCWPGQVWSEERERCAGSPRCPTGWIARGSLCVRGEITEEKTLPTGTLRTDAAAKNETAPKPVASPPRESRTEERRFTGPEDTNRRGTAPSTLNGLPIEYEYEDEDDDGRRSYDGGAVPRGYEVHTRVRRGLIIPGSIIFGVSYSLSALIAMSDLSVSSVQLETSACRNAPYFGLIPVFGAYVWGLRADAHCNPNRTVKLGTFFGAIDSTVQFAGATMMVLAFVLPEKYLMRVPSTPTDMSWQFVPGTQQTPSGLSIAGRF